MIADRNIDGGLDKNYIQNLGFAVGTFYYIC